MTSIGRRAQTSAILATITAHLGCVAADVETDVDAIDQEQQTADIIRQLGLETVPSVRVSEGGLRIYQANRRFATVRAGGELYLFETESDCPSLIGPYAKSFLGDYRTSGGWIRAGYDTIRDCRIRAIYPLPDEPAETTAEETGPNNTQEPD